MSFGLALALTPGEGRGGAYALGPELLSNGGFDTDTVWTKGTGWTIADGKATVSAPTAGSTLKQPVTIIAGRSYVASFAISDYIGGSVRIRLQNAGALVSNQPGYAANGTYSAILTASGAGDEFAFFAVNAAASLAGDSVSLRIIL